MMNNFIFTAGVLKVFDKKTNYYNNIYRELILYNACRCSGGRRVISKIFLDGGVGVNDYGE
jgi:hypothetical protein